MLNTLPKTRAKQDRIDLLLQIAQFHIFKPGENKADLDSAAVRIAEAKALTEDGNNPFILLTEAWLLKETGQQQASKAAIEKAIAEATKNKDNFHLGKAYETLASFYDYNDTRQRAEMIRLTKLAIRSFQAAGEERQQAQPARQAKQQLAYNLKYLADLYDLITSVADVDTSVLILGESGTGKERVADCIHQLSRRRDKPFVKVNCAALPESLIESELFGHEKGAFTGAHEKRIGKFEKADKGTIFLDEIGEMPAELQVKLLRVLQEKYIERVGSREPTKVDVRVIAATNRNLEKEVAEGRFRLDLYYRLNVFPIVLPPLRERTEDISDLAHHFMQYYNRKTQKKITGFSEKVLRNMTVYQWPGNIRELENLVERSVLLAKSAVIEDIAVPSHHKKDGTNTPQGLMKTIAENERDYIITVLKKCKGKIWGAGGAAEVLGIPPTTLTSKMKKLSIDKNGQ
jgi:transcriptional regulator with GAF, ATPase, and Fis domain